MRILPRDPLALPPGRPSILLVCTANVCRSPMAEGALRKRLRKAGLRFDIDSAATHDYMLGMPPFTLAVAVAKRRGYDITRVVARQVRRHDFEYFSLILGMGRVHVHWLRSIAPPSSRRKIRLLTEYSGAFRRRDIPDPYGGGVAGYELALDMIEDSCDGIVRAFTGRRHDAPLQLRSA